MYYFFSEAKIDNFLNEIFRQAGMDAPEHENFARPQTSNSTNNTTWNGGSQRGKKNRKKKRH